MWCPDGYFLAREVFNECSDIAFEAIESPPSWLSGFGELDLAFDGAIRSLAGKFTRPRDKANMDSLIASKPYVLEMGWEDIYREALRHWLLARFFITERYNLFLVLPSGNCLRVSSEAVRFVLGPGEDLFHASNMFFNEPNTVALLALGGAPFNFRFQPPAYVLRVEAPDEVASVRDIESQQLAPFNGAPLAWKSRKEETPRTVILRLFSELTLYSESGVGDQVLRKDLSQNRLRAVLEETWQAYPEGKGSTPWKVIQRKTGHSRRNIERALREFGERDRWAKPEQ